MNIATLSLEKSLRNIPMNRSDLISILSNKEKLKGKDATAIVNLMLNCFARALRNGDRVEIRGLGTSP